MNERKKRIKINFTQGCIITVLIYFALTSIFYFAAKEQLYNRVSKWQIETIAGDYATPEITNEFVLHQEFLCQMDRIERFTVNICTFARANTGSLQIRLLDNTANTELYRCIYNIADLADGQIVDCILPEKANGVREHILTIELSAPECSIGNAVAPWYASTINTENQQLYFKIGKWKRDFSAQIQIRICKRKICFL